jgi:hypothetical protein
MLKPSRNAKKNDRVAKIVKIIGRDKARIDQIEEAIRFFDRQLLRDELGHWPPYPRNKRDKTIARSFSLALLKLEKQLRVTPRSDRGGVLARATYGEADNFSEWQRQLKHWRERFEIFSGKAPAQYRGGLFSSGPTTWPLGRPKPSGTKFVRKRQAVHAAAEILQSHGLRLTATRKSGPRNASAFCRVAEALCGEGPLYHQCRDFIKKRGTGISISSS